jgi:2-polyprenyl-3-methyl-5-hydroxy-6-metoxy-1,4-benzoquinol methylase
MRRSLTAMMKDRINREEVYSTADFWNAKARAYEGSAVSMFVNRNLNEFCERDQFTFIDNCLGDIRGRNILDIGCGTGRLSRHLHDRGACVTGVDFAADAIALAKQRSEGRSIRFEVISVFDLPDNRSFDDVVALGCLSAACRTRTEFSNVVLCIYKILAPGGRLIMIEPFHSGFLHRVLQLSSDEAIAVLAASGLQVFRRAEMHFWPVRLVLSEFEWPRWLTAVSYSVGETLISWAGASSGLGDYKGIAARRRS